MLPATDRVNVAQALAECWLQPPQPVLPYVYFMRTGHVPGNHWQQQVRYLRAHAMNETRTRLLCHDIHTGEPVWLALFVFGRSGPRWQRVGDGDKAPRADHGCAWDAIDVSAPGVGCPVYVQKLQLVPAPPSRADPADPPATWERTQTVGTHE